MFEILPNWHPLFVHFTVALYTASFLFFVLGRVFFSQARAGECLTAAFWTLWLGAIISVLTVAAGFYAFNTVRHDALSHAAMSDHRNWALATAGTWWLIALWSLRKKETRPPRPSRRFESLRRSLPTRYPLQSSILRITDLPGPQPEWLASSSRSIPKWQTATPCQQSCPFPYRRLF